MDKAYAALVGLVIALVTACGARGPELRVVASEAPALTVRARDRLAKVTAPGLPLPAETQPKAPEPHAAPACSFEESEKLPAGFYPSEAWPKGEVVLTFDDGPHPGKTPKVLELLKKHGMPATFFLVGRAINKDTYALVQRMVAEGHTLASHSYNHDVGMAVRNHGERSVEYIRGQHEVTQILIELALVAKSGDDFDALFGRVFEEKAGTYLPGGALRSKWRSFSERHAGVLAARGFGEGRRPYPIVYSRPPAGTPYVGLSTPAQKQLYAAALSRLGMLNVMWHGESGDTNPQRKYDFAYLTHNLAHHARRGGVILIHDYIRTDALSVALSQISSDPSLRVVPIEVAVRRKYGCDSAQLARALAGPELLASAR
jgi:peptidoglycan/xylan/chitin deacetylase (PgdA/CDA1 family)